MAERPILFSAPMVRAILEGRKTQTRRIAKLNDAGRVSRGGCNWHIDDPDAVLACPYGVSGDTLWVRETWANIALKGYAPVYFYRASGNDLPPKDDRAAHSRWRPAIHMPRVASRITLRVAGVRLQRLMDVSEDDARAEGFSGWQNQEEGPRVPIGGGFTAQRCGEYVSDLGAFMLFWDKLHGDGATMEDPLVWAITFERLPPQHGGEHG